MQTNGHTVGKGRPTNGEPPDEPTTDQVRLTVAQAAASLGMTEGAGSACDLRALRGPELVELRLFEPLRSESLTCGLRERSGAFGGDEGDGAASEARAGQPRAQSTSPPRSFDKGVELGRGDLEVVAQGVVRAVHEMTEASEVFRP